MEHPVAPYLIPLGIGQFTSRSEPDPLGLEITTWYPEDLDPELLDPFTDQHQMVRFLSGLFGPYPFETLGAMVVDAGLRLALEHQTLPTYDRSLVLETVVVHELAHQWFGNSVSVADWSDIWLNEGPATLAEWLWTEEIFGVIDYDREVANAYRLFSGEFFLSGDTTAAIERATAISPPPVLSPRPPSRRRPLQPNGLWKGSAHTGGSSATTWATHPSSRCSGPGTTPIAMETQQPPSSCR